MVISSKSALTDLLRALKLCQSTFDHPATLPEHDLLLGGSTEKGEGERERGRGRGRGRGGRGGRGERRERGEGGRREEEGEGGEERERGGRGGREGDIHVHRGKGRVRKGTFLLSELVTTHLVFKSFLCSFL